MQTFLPHPDFALNASVLDNKRLGKQRVEGLQIYRALTRSNYGWQHHPAVLQWRGHEAWIKEYICACCAEWRRRGFLDTIETKLRAEFDYDLFCHQRKGIAIPLWLGDERYHSSHRAALLAKDFEYYSKFGWTEEPKIDYWWPTKNKQGDIK